MGARMFMQSNQFSCAPSHIVTVQEFIDYMLEGSCRPTPLTRGVVFCNLSLSLFCNMSSGDCLHTFSMRRASSTFGEICTTCMSLFASYWIGNICLSINASCTEPTVAE